MNEIRKNYFNSDAVLQILSRYGIFDLASILKRLEYQSKYPDIFYPGTYDLNKELYTSLNTYINQKINQPVPQPIPAATPQPVPEPVYQPVPEPVYQPVPEPVYQPVPEPVYQLPPRLSKKPIPVKKDGTPDMRYSLNKYQHEELSSSYGEASSSRAVPRHAPLEITYSQHALDQMDLPERDISQREVHDIISKGLRKNDYTMSDDNPPRRIFIKTSKDPNNFIKVITSDSDTNPHVITAIRNNPIDDYFSYSALQTIEEEDLDKNFILDLVKNEKKKNSIMIVYYLNGIIFQ